jgi:hypothetical protein
VEAVLSWHMEREKEREEMSIIAWGQDEQKLYIKPSNSNIIDMILKQSQTCPTMFKPIASSNKG